MNMSIYICMQGRIQGVFEAGIPVWAPKKIFQVTLFLMEYFGLIFFPIKYSQGLKKMCDCTLKYVMCI